MRRSPSPRSCWRIYLASYYFGGLTGAAVLGRVFEASGWNGTALIAGAAFVLATVLALTLRERDQRT